jgi:hypothetical protein
MSHWWKLIVPLGLAFAITGFGGPAASGGTPPGPDEPSVSSTSPPRDVDSTPPPLVTPRPGMAGGRALLVNWWSGVEPCQVLDRVEVQERPPEVVVTLYEGHDPAQPDVECIDIAMEKTTLVKLDTSLGARKIVDGSR